MTTQELIDKVRQVARRRGAISLDRREGCPLQYHDDKIFIQIDLATEQLWFSVKQGRENRERSDRRGWEPVIDILPNGEIDTLAVYIQADSLSWQEYLDFLWHESAEWPDTQDWFDAQDNDDPIKILGLIAQVDVALLRTAIATIEALVAMGVISLVPVLTLVNQLAIHLAPSQISTAQS